MKRESAPGLMFRFLVSTLAGAVIALPAGAAGDEASLQQRQRKLDALLADAGQYYQYILLDTAARTALELDQYDRAHNLATRLLALSEDYRDDWNYGNAVHQGHIVLGQVAYIIDDLPAAKQHLIAACDTTPVKPVRTPGPELELAMQLLQAGENETVVRYLEKCRNLWPDNARLEPWIREITADESPPPTTPTGGAANPAGTSSMTEEPVSD